MSTRQRAILLRAIAVLIMALGTVGVMAVELLNDPGFEESNPAAQIGAWRQNMSGAIKVADQSPHGGRQFLTLAPGTNREVAVYQGLRGLDVARKYVILVWARGSGKLQINVYQYTIETTDAAGSATDNAQFKPGAMRTVCLRTQTGPLSPLGAEWRHYEFSFTPDQRASAIAAAFHVQGGEGDLDDASLVLEGEAADEQAVPLRFRQVEGCAWDAGILHPKATAIQPQGATGVVMEAEQAWPMSLEPAGGVHDDAKASGGRCVDFSSGLTFRVDLATGGDYQAWYRLNIPFLAHWCHSESIGDQKRNSGDVHPADALAPNTWSWRPGPTYTLSAGKHEWVFDNWHGGIRLDQVALLPVGTRPPEDGDPLAPTPVRVAARVQASSDPLMLFSVKAWRRLAFVKRPESGNARWEVSTDGGRAWAALPNSGDLSALSLKSDRGIVFRVTLAGTDEPVDPRMLTTVADMRAVYVPGEIPDFKVVAPKVAFRVTGLSGRLTELTNRALGVRYDLPASQGQPLFSLQVRRKDPPYALDTLTTLDAQLIEGAVEKGKRGGQRFRFRYSLEGSALLVSGHLDADDSEILRGRISVENQGPDEVLAVGFPLLGNLAIAGDAADDVLITPAVQGTRFDHPAMQLFSYPRYWTWPGWMSMAYCDLYDRKANAGLYLAMYDAMFTTTEFMFHGSPDGAVFSEGLQQWLRVRPGQKWESPEAIIGLHTGDWHWAADRYREWAMTWFQQGNTPRWLRETDGYVGGGPLWYGPYDYSLLSAAAELCAPCGIGLVGTWGHMITANGACGVCPLLCPLYGGAGNFRWTSRKIHELGAHANYYIQGHLVNPQYHRDNSFIGNMPRTYVPDAEWVLLPDKDFFARWRLIEPNGSAADPSSYSETYADAGKREFNDYLSDWALRYIRDYGADGIYFDGFAIGSAWPSINYDSDASTSGDWGRGQLRMIRRCKEEGRKLNPDVVFGMEGCSDVYQQWGDWGLMSARNAMEMFRYTFPDLICIGGSANGDITKVVEQLFMNAYRMDSMLYGLEADTHCKHPDHLVPWGSRVAKIRRIVTPFLFRARYMDTVGVLKADEGVDARLMVRNDRSNRGVLALLHNTGEKPGKAVVVDTAGWGPVEAAWRVTWQGIEPLAGRQDGTAYHFELPADKFTYRNFKVHDRI